MGPTSDRRLKSKVQTLKNSIDTILKLQSVYFTWDEKNDKVQNYLNPAQEHYYEKDSVGYIAQEVEMVLPQVVWTEDDGYKRLEYGLIVALCIGSLQEQQKRINSIYEKIKNIKSKLVA